MDVRNMMLLLAFLAAFLFSFGAVASAKTQAEYIAIALNDRLVSFPDATPEVVKGITYMPVRIFAEAMGAQVDYDPDEETVRIVSGKSVLVDIPKKTITTPAGISMPLNLFLKKNRLMVPFRLLGETIGYEVSYRPEGPVARAKDDTAQLSDEELYEKYRDVIEAEKEKLPDKIAYLTFDDGPNQYTAQILDTLARYDAKATFFMLAGQIESYPNEVKRMASSGHGLALHGVTHNATRIYASAQSVVNEMEQCNAALTRVTGLRTNMVRVPYGSKPWMTQSYRDALVDAGYRMWDWNVDSYDSRGTNIHPDDIVREVVEQTAQHEVPVILLHDREATLLALPRILEHLQQNGYDLRPLQGNMAPLNFWNDQR
jgi:peptidoglycan/xylan/chitin deacetylase (PgdA/CDA1 family)